jgi:hypothetical protein
VDDGSKDAGEEDRTSDPERRKQNGTILSHGASSLRAHRNARPE